VSGPVWTPALTATPPWLVTGATGFLGRHLLETLQRAAPARPVVALVRDLEGWNRWHWTIGLTRVSPLTGSLTESGPPPWARDTSLDGLAGIVHLAALVRHSRRDAEEVYQVNVEGTLAMVRLAADRRCRLILLSTSGTVGCFETPDGTADEDAAHCEDLVRSWPYYHSKVLAEREARRLAEQLGVALVIVRPPVLLGPGDHRFRSTAILLRFLRGRLPFLVRGGMHYTDVRDVADALVRLMDFPEPRLVYHLPGTVCTVEEFFTMADDVWRAEPRRGPSPGRPRVLPTGLVHRLARLDDRLGRLLRGRPLGLLPDPSLVEMASRYWALTSRYAEQDLGYRPRPGMETLRDTVDWLLANTA